MVLVTHSTHPALHLFSKWHTHPQLHNTSLPYKADSVAKWLAESVISQSYFYLLSPHNNLRVIVHLLRDIHTSDMLMQQWSHSLNTHANKHSCKRRRNEALQEKHTFCWLPVSWPEGTVHSGPLHTCTHARTHAYTHTHSMLRLPHRSDIDLVAHKKHLFMCKFHQTEFLRG